MPDVEVVGHAVGAVSAKKRRGIRRAIYWSSAAFLVALVLSGATYVTAAFWRVPELAPSPIGGWMRDLKGAITPHALSIAVLPFDSHGDPDAGEFADALSEGITTALSISSERCSPVSRSINRRL